MVKGVKYSGTCKGGPLNGKALHHPEGRFFMFKREGKIISYTMPPAGAKDLPAEISVGAYEWDDDDKCWQWTREVS